MAIDAYMHIKGQRQGAITGDVTQRNEQGSIRVNDLSYSVASPRDASTGLPTGKRQHHPVQVTVPTGRQTPLVFEAIVTNENLVSVLIHVYEPAPNGVEALAFTIELTNASVFELDLNYQSSPAAELADRYSFTFQKIVVTWAKGAITAQDDWESPVT